MLDQALKVVEAARGMKLTHKDGRTFSDLPDRQLSRAIEALRLSIEEFDVDTGRAGPGDIALKIKPGSGIPESSEEEGAVLPTLNMNPKFRLQDESVPLADTQEAVEAQKDTDIPSPLPKPVLAAATLAALTAANSSADFKPGLYDVGDDGVFFDGDESAADLMLSMGAINDKLAFAVGKVGWSPRLRAMAEALRIAQHNMYIEVDNGNGWVRIPAQNWGTLTVAIAESALDQDLSIALPQPRPRSSQDIDHERRNLPKPPPDMF